MKKQIIFFFCFSILVSCAIRNTQDDNKILGRAIVTIVINCLPEDHDFNADIYISGDFEGWSGGREQFKLKQKDSSYIIDIPKYKETISYKFTKGNWSNVECLENGNPIDNRTFMFNKQKDTVFVTIPNWNNTNNQNNPSTATSNVHVFDENILISELNRTRRVSVYLPPNYETSNESYPVLYIQDGQNVFDLSTSYAGEWEVDETLNEIFETTGFSLIVVALDHGEEKRINEYSAWDSKKNGKGEGKAYLEFIINSLKPKIDSTFRTKPNRNNTVIMGSSLGGLFAHFAVLDRPDVFGKAGIFSPSFWFAKDCIDFTKQHANLKKSRLYYLVGDKEDFQMVNNMKNMVKLMNSNGFPENNMSQKIVINGAHSESLWKKEFKEAIIWLFEVNNKS